MAKSWYRYSIPVCSALLALSWLFYLTPIAHRLENQYALGLLYDLRGSRKPPENAAIIAVDRRTTTWLRELITAPQESHRYLMACLPEEARGELRTIRGPGTLPRSVHACLIRQLTKIGFPVIAFDILFSESGIDSDDAMLSKAIGEHGATAILVGLERSTVRDGTSELLVEREVQPIALISKEAATTGTFVVTRSGGPVYGYWREVSGFEDLESLPEAAFHLHKPRRPNDASGKDNDRSFLYFWLYGQPGSILTVSARDILAGQISESLRRQAQDSVAFVGASDPSMTNYIDTFPSFYRAESGANISGVELAATAYLNLSSGEVLRTLSPTGQSALVLFSAFFLIFIAVTQSGFAILAIPIAAAGYVAFASYMFSQIHTFLPVSTPVFVLAPITLLMAVVSRYRLARVLLTRLAPAQIARRMLQRTTNERMELIPSEASVLFFDLIGSSGIAETVSPIDFSTLLNSYHDTVGDQVQRKNGEIIAFSGDGVMAAFTKSECGVDHAKHACQSAIDIVMAIGELNTKNALSGIPSIHVRVGVNSGSVAEGEIGAHDRFNFSVVGDVVNLASRLEQLGKTLFPDVKDVILVGRMTYQMAGKRHYSFVDCGLQEIRGRKNPESVYRLLAKQ